MPALRGLACLLLLQALGEGLVHALGWPIPGPVLGMGLLLPALAWAPLRAWVAAAADLLLAHLSLLFVPVGVGVITHLDLVARHGLQLLVVIALSTWVGMAVTAWVLNRCWRPDAAGGAGPGDGPAEGTAAAVATGPAVVLPGARHG